MTIKYLLSKDLVKSLQKANISGGQKKKRADKVKAIISDLQHGFAEPFENVSVTNRGENRLKGGIKYDLGNGYRLVTQQKEKICVLIYFGDHEEVKDFLNKRRGYDFCYDRKNEEIKTVFNSTNENKVSLEINYDSDEKLWDKLEKELDDLTKGLPASLTYLKKVSEIKSGAEEFEIDKIIEELKSSIENIEDKHEQIILVLRDILVALNSKEEDKAINIYHQYLGQLETITETSNIKIIKKNESYIPVNEEFSQLIEKFINSENPNDWLLFTHPDQDEIILENYKQPVHLSGVSGSGKTSILINRIIDTAPKINEHEKILVVTLNDSLSKLIKDALSVNLSEEDFNKISNFSFFNLCEELLSIYDQSIVKNYVQISYGLEEHFEEVFREYYRCEVNNEDARVMFDLHKKLLSNGIAAEKYIKDEFEWVRSFLTYKNLNDYIGKERVGRKFGFTEDDRKKIIQGIIGWKKKLDAVGLADLNHILCKVMDYEDKINPIFKHTFVDEVQDFGVNELKLLRKITFENENDFFMTGDVAQTVLPKVSNYKAAGIGKVKKLEIKLNYRNTVQILEAANQIFMDNMDESFIDNSEAEMLQPEYSKRSGERPIIMKSKDLLSEIKDSFNFAEMLSKENQNYKICIVFCGYSNYELTQYSKMLDNRYPFLDGSNKLTEGNIFISDLEQIKGFEFDIVIIINCNKTILPPDDIPKEERFRVGCKLYVAMTRAKHRLFLIYSEKISSWLEKAMLRGYLDELKWEDFITSENLKNKFILPRKLPQVTEDIRQNAVLRLNGKNFLYTSYAEGLDKNYLDFIEENVTGHTHFKKKNKKTKRTKWETINHLYKDLKYNQMQKQFPFYYSEKGDSIMLNLFQKIDEEKE